MSLRKISLTQWIMISMVIGVAIGALFPAESQQLKVVSNVFLRLIKCLLVPLVFGTLVFYGYGNISMTVNTTPSTTAPAKK